MVCPNCKKEIKKQAKFCPHCGTNPAEFKKKKKEEKKKKILKIKVIVAITLFLMLVLLWIFLIAQNIYFIKNNFEYKKNDKQDIKSETQVQQNNSDDYKEKYLTITEEKFELTEENKGEDYDKDGLTNEEEIAAGTSPFLEDSDGDGLSDYEEVNYYKSNPTKYSSSDDGISDYVKARKNMEFDKKYEKSEIELKENKYNSQITLIPNDINSEVLGKIETFSNTAELKSIGNKFTVYEFEGKIEYKLEKVDVILLTEYAGKYTEFDDYTVKTDKMIINIDEDDNSKVFTIATKDEYKKYQVKLKGKTQDDNKNSEKNNGGER